MLIINGITLVTFSHQKNELGSYNWHLLNVELYNQSECNFYLEHRILDLLSTNYYANN